MKEILLVATVTAALLGAGTLQAKTYSCTVTPDSSRDWISKTLAFNIDDASGMIRVFDGIIETYGGNPVMGKLSAQTAKRITISWETRRVSDDYSHTAARFLFRATYFKNSGKLAISSVPGGFDNMFGGRGRCTVSSDAGWATALRAAKAANFSARGKEQFIILRILSRYWKMDEGQQNEG